MQLRTLALASAFAIRLFGQAADEDFHAYKDHPRLLLNAQRLKFLKRERSRTSERWQQFETLMRGKARMAEPGFAWALYYQVAGDEAAGKQAVDWALGPGTDPRQLAFVYDWCQPLLSPDQASALRRKLGPFLKADWAKLPISGVRSAAFAAVALGDDTPGIADVLKNLVNTWWRARYATALKSGTQVPLAAELFPLMELLHVIRDNFNVELRDDAGAFFRSLPSLELLTYYPATYPAAENDYHIPSFKGAGEPDLQKAALARAAEFALVAYDNVSTESQFLQGWLLHDRYNLRGSFGAPYEFFWANPYQPGLSYYHVPLTMHDPISGRVYARSSWDEDATWLGYFNEELQMFEAGKIRLIPLDKQKTVIAIGSTVVAPAKAAAKYTVPADGPSTMFVVGLQPKHAYLLEVDDEELDEREADIAGTIALTFTRKDQRVVRISPLQSGVAAASAPQGF